MFRKIPKPLKFILISGILLVLLPFARSLTRDMVSSNAYVKYLSTNVVHTVTIPADTSNQLVLQPVWYNDQGIQVSMNPDGSYLINGKNISPDPIYIQITSSSFRLSPGKYRVSVGNDSAKGVYLCLSSVPVSSEKKTVKYQVKGSESKLTWVYLVIKPEAEFSNMVVYPSVVLNSSKDGDSLLPAVIDRSLDEDASQTVCFFVSKDDFLKIPRSDMDVFVRNLQYIYHGKYAWCTIDFGDGSGIVFEDCDPGKASYGMIDSYGRVYKKEADKDFTNPFEGK